MAQAVWNWLFHPHQQHLARGDVQSTIARAAAHLWRAGAEQSSAIPVMGEIILGVFARIARDNRALKS
ncbi:hypothetical protein SBA2_50015 [Acidobacteriia bacterium SbA2]|nr:hypothetical protein SBA2_50015 [Acidobacteriia bacterium SbA2]